MEFIFEIIQVIAEIFLELLAEILFELGFHGLAEALDRKTRRDPVLAAIGYLLWGGIIGVITLLVFSTSIIKNPTLRILNVVISPIGAGLAMSAIGSWRRKRGQDTLRIDTFIYGTLFALGLTLVRFLYGIYWPWPELSLPAGILRLLN